MIRRRRHYIERSRRPIKRTRLRRSSMAGRRGLMARADKLCGAIVRARGKCERCGSREVLQWAHIFSRKYLSVRWDTRNAMCLCRGCHFYFTVRPIEWEDWARHKLGAEYDLLRARALTVGKLDMMAIVLSLGRA